MLDIAAFRETREPRALAGLIHDDILQALGAAVLGVDLARRLHQRLRYEQALDELSGIVAALGQALASSEALLPELRLLAPSSAPALTRPSLMIVVDVAGMAAAGRPPAGPDEIVQTIATCELQARRCLGAYDAGLGEDAMHELGLMLQRLEFVTAGFRTLMTHLRETTPTPALLPLLPALSPLPSLTAMPALARSA